MRWGKMAVFTALILILVCGYALAGGGEKVLKEFDGVKAVRLNTVSGDCIVETHRSDRVIVDLFYDVDPDGSFKYEINERRGKLVIKERWRGHSTSGEVIWHLTVPEGAEIEFSAASGDLSVTGPVGSVEGNTASGDIEIEDSDGDIEISTASGDVTIINANGEKDISTASGDIHIEDSGDEIELSTASGDIEAENLEGEIELSTASGDIEVSNSKGIFDISCASGEIEAEDIIIEGASEFSAASGEVTVVLAETCEFDLSLSAASGDVTLDYGGNKVKGYFELEARKRRGSIDCPFDFDDEEEFERDGRTFVRKSFSQKGDTPEIFLSTWSGKVVLKK